MSEITNMAKRAKAAASELAQLKSETKNQILNAVASEILARREQIKAANQIDLKNGESSGLSSALLDRLRLTDARIEAMAAGVRELANFADPVGEVLGGWRHANGMQISKIRVPLGVIAMIYESRPNVSIDASALALKSQNAIILRGSGSAINSNKFLVDLFNETGAKFGLPAGAVQLIKSTDRGAVGELIKMHEFIDVVIPRGGKNLKEFILKNATVPVIETGAGVCQIFVDESADLAQAVAIIKNAKTQRPSVCNAVEYVLLHEKIAGEILPLLARELAGVQMRLHEDLWDKFGADLSAGGAANLGAVADLNSADLNSSVNLGDAGAAKENLNGSANLNLSDKFTANTSRGSDADGENLSAQNRQNLDSNEISLSSQSEQNLGFNGANLDKISGSNLTAASVIKADESDFGAEFLDMILAVRAVAGVSEAISYINERSSGHSDAILSRDAGNIERFLNAVNSAVVYANASTRFSDGGEFGFGGEIGISTQKLHARGPMGVRELTTYKYVVRGSGQVR